MSEWILILFYVWGCVKALNVMLAQKNKWGKGPYQKGERLIMVFLVPMSWITVVGLILMEIKEDIRRNTYN